MLVTPESPQPTLGRTSRASRCVLVERAQLLRVSPARQVLADTDERKVDLEFSGSFLRLSLRDIGRAETQARRPFEPDYDDGREPRAQLRIVDWPRGEARGSRATHFQSTG